MFIMHGPLMDEAGDAGGGGTAVETTDLALSPGTDLATTTDPGDGIAEGEFTEVTSPETALATQTPTDVATALAPLKTTAPKVYGELQRARNISERLTRVFPAQNPFDGIKALKREVTDYKQLGSVQDLRDTLGDIEKMDLQFANGDPAFLDRLTETPEGAAAFAKLMPTADAKWAQAAPEAWQKHKATIILNDVLTNRLDMALVRIAEVVPKETSPGVPNPLYGELQRFQAWFNNLVAWDKKEVAAPVVPTSTTAKPDTEIERRRQEQDRREQTFELRQWRSETDTDLINALSSAWTETVKGRTVKPIDREDIEARIKSGVTKALLDTPGFQESLKGYFTGKNKAGYLTYLKSRYAQIVPLVTRREIDRRLGAKPGPGTAAASPGRSAPVTSTPQGFKKVAKPPTSNDIDFRLTRGIYHLKQAVLKDGSKVTWA